MTALEVCERVRACWDALFRARYVQFLEAENARLRLKLERLELRSLAFPGESAASPARNPDMPFAVPRIRNPRSAVQALHERMWKAPESSPEVESAARSADDEAAM